MTTAVNPNSFQKIVGDDVLRTVALNKIEIELIEQVRQIASHRRNCGVLVSYKDGKLVISKVLPMDTASA